MAQHAMAWHGMVCVPPAQCRRCSAAASALALHYAHAAPRTADSTACMCVSMCAEVHAYLRVDACVRACISVCACAVGCVPAQHNRIDASGVTLLEDSVDHIGYLQSPPCIHTAVHIPPSAACVTPCVHAFVRARMRACVRGVLRVAWHRMASRGVASHRVASRDVA